jgi:glycine cleavage system H protein
MISVRNCGFPEALYYHTQLNIWLRPDAPGVVTLGVTSYAVALAVEFLAFTPKTVGKEIDSGRAVGLLELAKTIVSVRTPVAGTLIAANDLAATRPSTINRDPYDAGWLVQLRVNDWQSAARDLVAGEMIATAFEEAMRLDNFKGLVAGD